MATPGKWTEPRKRAFLQMRHTHDVACILERFGISQRGLSRAVSYHGLRKQDPSKPWTDDEVAKLRTAAMRRGALQALAGELGRSAKACTQKLVRMRRKERIRSCPEQK